MPEEIRKLVHAQRVKKRSHAEMASSSSSSSSSTEAPTGKPCRACNAKRDAGDPVAEWCKKEEENNANTKRKKKNRRFPKFTRWEWKGSFCWYCWTTWQKAYSDMKRKEFENKARDTVSGGKKEVMERRDKIVVAVCETNGNFGRDIENTMGVQPTESVVATHTSSDRRARRGKNFRMDKFEKYFPNTNPKTVGCVFERPSRDGKTIEKWVKVFKFEDGIKEFSEASDDAIAHNDVLDDGSSIMDENQMRDAATRARASLLTHRQTAGLSMDAVIAANPDSKFAPRPAAPAAAAPSGSVGSGQTKNEQGSASDSDGSGCDERAPMRRGPFIVKSKKEGQAFREASTRRGICQHSDPARADRKERQGDHEEI
mgnify:CR=1 FL=1